MPNDSIERFDLTVLESSVKHVNPDGKMMYVAEHQRIVKELEARVIELERRPRIPGQLVNNDRHCDHFDYSSEEYCQSCVRRHG